MTLLLIVDDDPSTLDLLEILFKKEGYQIIKADGGHGALALARKYKPQLILLDLMMPDMDGIAVCRAIRRDPEISRTPVLILTAARSVDKKQEVLDSGANGYLVKPVHPAELRDQVSKFLQASPQAEPSRSEPEQIRRNAIAVLGTSGGAGTTTVAVNLAATCFKEYEDAALAELIPGSDSLIPQLGFTYGSPGGHSFSGANPQDLRQALRKHPCGLEVLVLPQGDDAVDQIHGIVEQLSSSHRCVVLDLGRGFNSRVKAVQPFISDYVVVMRADTLALPHSIKQVKQLIQNGVSWDQIHIVLVSFGAYPYFLNAEQSKQVLQAGGIQNNVLMYLPAMRQLVYMANEQRTPMVTVYPEGQKLERYFQEALKRLNVEKKPV